MSLLIDPNTRRIVAQTSDTYLFEDAAFLIVAEPEGFMYSTAGDWHWNGEELVYVPGNALFTQNEFSQRFTNEELARVCEAAASYAGIAAWLERFRATKTIDLDSEALKAGVTALEIAGLIGAGRAEEICQ